MTNFRALLPCLMISMAAAACGDSSAAGGAGQGGEGEGGSGTNAAATELVSVDSGGTVTDDGHAVTLAIPAGAVAEDTEVSLFIEAKRSDTASEVFSFEPDGLSLAVPATLTIDIFDLTFPEGQTAALVVEEGGSWVEVPDASFGSGTIGAAVSTLGTFSVIFVEAAGQGACEASCESCCTTCGCMAGECTPVCPSATPWDCEIGCCFDYELLECAG